jgi:hypothetical protein
MSQQNYQEKLAEIQAIDPKLAVTPNIPIAIALQEAENLYQWCQDDKAALTARGLDWHFVDDLPARTGACRYAQSIWIKEHKSQQEIEKQWKKEAPKAYELRNELLHHFFFAYRNMPDIKVKVAAIAEGSGHADMLQDLSDLSVLGKQYLQQLIKIGMDLSLLDQASQYSGTLGSLLAQVNGINESDSSTKVLRDKAFLLMKQAVDEIRQCGQYTFWRNPDRKKGYASLYFRHVSNRTGKRSEKSGASSSK